MLEDDDIEALRSIYRRENRTHALLELRQKLFEMNLMRYDQMNSSVPHCERYVDKYPDYTNETVPMIIFALLYAHIFVLGLIGNLAILFLTLRNRHLQTVQNIFILNLSISDVLICLTSLPITPITTVYKTWYFSSPVCKLIPLVQGSSVFVSTFSLSAIALDRYNLVVRPHKHPLNTRGAAIVALCLWIAAVIVCMPYGWYMEVTEIPHLCGEFCTEHWPLPGVRKAYALMVLVMQFLFPFATMTVCYYVIFSRLKTRAEQKLKKISERSLLLETSTASPDLVSVTKKPDRNRKSVCSLEGKQRIAVIANQRRTTMILASMVLFFGIAWLPHNVITLMIEYDDQFFHGQHLDHTYIVSLIAHLISMTINVVNPVLYAWLNPTFKDILLKTLRRSGKRSNEKRKETNIVLQTRSATPEHNL